MFQHIPSQEVIENYVREVHRLLRPGDLFKFQVQGTPGLDNAPDDTWPERCGFEARYRVGAGTQDFWLWFFRR